MTGFQLFSTGFRTVYSSIGVVYALVLGQIYGFNVTNSFFLGATWVTTTLYIILDTLFGIELPTAPDLLR